MSPSKPATSNSWRRDERGSVTIELVILLPALFAVMFLGMQAALFYHARTLAIAAAQEGAQGAAENGRPVDGVNTATSFVAGADGNGVLSGASATTSRTATTVTVTVTGHSLSVIPGWSPVIVQSATVPIEKLTAP